MLVCVVDWSFTGRFARSCIARVARFELARNEAESADSCLQAMLLLPRFDTKVALQNPGIFRAFRATVIRQSPERMEGQKLDLF